MHVHDGLSELPAVAGEIVDDAGSFAVFKRLRFVDDGGARVAGPGQGGVDIGYTDLEKMCVFCWPWHYEVAGCLGDHERTVFPDAHLGAVAVADSHAFFRVEGALEKGNSGADVGIDQDRRNCGWWSGAIAEHESERYRPTGPRQCAVSISLLGWPMTLGMR
jgi:hypothetical protein